MAAAVRRRRARTRVAAPGRRKLAGNDAGQTKQECARITTRTKHSLDRSSFDSSAGTLFRAVRSRPSCAAARCGAGAGMAAAGKSAAAKAMAAAQEVVERKLRPVYDAVDCRNYKLALKSINAIIQVRRTRAHPPDAKACMCLHVALGSAGRS